MVGAKAEDVNLELRMVIVLFFFFFCWEEFLLIERITLLVNFLTSLCIFFFLSVIFVPLSLF